MCLMQIIQTIDNILHPIKTWDKWLAQKEADRKYLEVMTRKDDYISADSCYLFYLYGVIKMDTDEDLWAKGIAAKQSGNPLMGFATIDQPPEIILNPNVFSRENNSTPIISGQAVNLKTSGIKFIESLDEAKVLQEKWKTTNIYECVYMERTLVSIKEKDALIK